MHDFPSCFLHSPPAFSSENFFTKPGTASSSQGLLPGTRLRQGRKCLDLPSCNLALVSPRRFMTNAGLFSPGTLFGVPVIPRQEILSLAGCPKSLSPCNPWLPVVHRSQGTPVGITLPLQMVLLIRDYFKTTFLRSPQWAPMTTSIFVPQNLGSAGPSLGRYFSLCGRRLLSLGFWPASALTSSDINEEPVPVPQPRGHVSVSEWSLKCSRGGLGQCWEKKIL